MEIKRDRESKVYTFDNRALGNCFTVYNGKDTYHYEFEVNKNQALVKYDSILFIKDAINEFRKYNKNVIQFYNSDRSFYLGFDEIHTFKLPIDILQPSKFFIDQDKYNAIEKHLKNEEFVVPVCIIDDEYVLLDGHTRARYLIDNYIKMIDVYMDTPSIDTQNYVYIAKENNLFKVKNMEILPHEEYLEYLAQTGIEDN